MQASAKAAGVPLYAVDYHSYSHDLTPTSILQPRPITNSSIWQAFDHTDTQIWIGEAGSCGGGGRPNMSDTFANGFWFLSTLGRLAQLNHKLFLRQDFVGAYYGLLRDRFLYTNQSTAVTPNVDFFNAVLFKRLMGTQVLAVVSTVVSMKYSYSNIASRELNA